MSRVIAIANQKGGVGKTTTTVNTATAIAECNKKVLIIDIDPQGNACSGIGLNKNTNQKGIYEVLLMDEPVENVIQETNYKNLYIVPVNIHLAAATIQLVNIENREFRFKNAIKNIRDSFAYIFVDCPPSLGLLTLNALVAADSVMIPLQCEYFALEGIAQLLQTINRVKKKLNPSLQIEGVLLTMFDSRTNLSTQVMEDAAGHFKNKVYKTIIPRNVKLAEAPSFGKPITQYEINSIGAKSYKKLSMEIMNNG